MSLTAFVTGGTGFLGRRLVHSLLAEGAEVRCLVRTGSDVDGAFKSIPEADRARIQLVRGDLSDRASYEDQLEGTDVVYHLAAALGGSTSAMFLNTVSPTRQLLNAACVMQVPRFVLVSSMGVYGTQTLRRGGTLDETTPVDPHPEQRDPYTFSKVRQESLAWLAREQFGLPLTVVRPGVIYGPGRTLLTSRVGLSLGPLFVRMGGGQQLPFTYVDNCAEAIKLAGTTPGLEGQAFNVVDDNLPNGKQILRAVKRHGKRVRTLWTPRLAIGPLSSMYEWYSRWSEGQLPPVITRYKSEAIWKPLRYVNVKAKEHLHWRPQVSTTEGIERTLAAGVL